MGSRITYGHGSESVSVIPVQWAYKHVAVETGDQSPIRQNEGLRELNEALSWF